MYAYFKILFCFTYIVCIIKLMKLNMLHVKTPYFQITILM